MITLIPVLLFYYQQISMGNTSPILLKDYAVVESLVAQVDPQVVTAVIDKESGFDPTRIHKDDGAVGCDSIGLVQIRNCNHQEVSFEQATNPVFSVNFLIKNIDKCKTWWLSTCGSVK